MSLGLRAATIATSTAPKTAPNISTPLIQASTTSSSSNARKYSLASSTNSLTDSPTGSFISSSESDISRRNSLDSLSNISVSFSRSSSLSSLNLSPQVTANERLISLINEQRKAKKESLLELPPGEIIGGHPEASNEASLMDQESLKNPQQLGQEQEIFAIVLTKPEEPPAEVAKPTASEISVAQPDPKESANAPKSPPPPDAFLQLPQNALPAKRRAPKQIKLYCTDRESYYESRKVSNKICKRAILRSNDYSKKLFNKEAWERLKPTKAKYVGPRGKIHTVINLPNTKVDINIRGFQNIVEGLERDPQNFLLKLKESLAIAKKIAMSLIEAEHVKIINAAWRGDHRVHSWECNQLWQLNKKNSDNRDQFEVDQQIAFNHLPDIIRSYFELYESDWSVINATSEAFRQKSEHRSDWELLRNVCAAQAEFVKSHKLDFVIANSPKNKFVLDWSLEVLKRFPDAVKTMPKSLVKKVLEILKFPKNKRLTQEKLEELEILKKICGAEGFEYLRRARQAIPAIANSEKFNQILLEEGKRLKKQDCAVDSKDQQKTLKEKLKRAQKEEYRRMLDNAATTISQRVMGFLGTNADSDTLNQLEERENVRMNNRIVNESMMTLQPAPGDYLEQKIQFNIQKYFAGLYDREKSDFPVQVDYDEKKNRISIVCKLPVHQSNTNKSASQDLDRAQIRELLAKDIDINTTEIIIKFEDNSKIKVAKMKVKGVNADKVTTINVGAKSTATVTGSSLTEAAKASAPTLVMPEGLTKALKTLPATEVKKASTTMPPAGATTPVTAKKSSVQSPAKISPAPVAASAPIATSSTAASQAAPKNASSTTTPSGASTATPAPTLTALVSPTRPTATSPSTAAVATPSSNSSQGAVSLGSGKKWVPPAKVAPRIGGGYVSTIPGNVVIK